MSDSTRQSAQGFHFVGLEGALVRRRRLNLFHSRLTGPRVGLFRGKAPPEQGRRPPVSKPTARPAAAYKNGVKSMDCPVYIVFCLNPTFLTANVKPLTARQVRLMFALIGTAPFPFCDSMSYELSAPFQLYRSENGA